jgi:SPOR domain
VALLASDEAAGAGWAQEVALGLARSWSSGTHAVTLVDAAIERPSLHRYLSLPNTEGLAEALAQGGVGMRGPAAVEDGRYGLLTAGSSRDDPEETFTPEAWSAASAALTDDGSLVLAYVSASAAGVGAVVASATDIVVLADVGDELPPELASDARLIAVLGIAGGPRGTEPDAAEEDPLEEWVDPLAALGSMEEPTPEVPVEPVAFGNDPTLQIDDDDDHQASEDESWEEIDAVLETAPEVPVELPLTAEAPAPLPRTGGKARAHLTAIIVTSVLLIFSVVAVISVLQRNRNKGPSDAVATDAAIEPPPAAGGGGAPPTSAAAGSDAATRVPTVAPSNPTPRYSIALAAYGDPGLAASRLRAVRRKAPGQLFTLAPIRVGDRVFLRLLAGVASDSLGATRAAAELSQSLGESSAPWMIRQTPMAFLLGSEPTLDGADARVRALSEEGISAYLLSVDLDDGTVQYRVYAGAYANAGEASELSARLGAAGEPTDRFEERIGAKPTR